MPDLICLNTDDRHRLLLIAVIFRMPIPTLRPIAPRAYNEDCYGLPPIGPREERLEPHLQAHSPKQDKLTKDCQRQRKHRKVTTGAKWE
jgi:hypothetical protein